MQRTTEQELNCKIPSDSTFIRTGPETHMGWLPVQVARAGKASDTVPATAGPGRESELLEIAASVESEDRAGDLVIARGWELDAYMRNPVVPVGASTPHAADCPQR